VIATYGILSGFAILIFWAFILWIGTRIDKPHLELEHYERAFNDDGKANNKGRVS